MVVTDGTNDAAAVTSAHRDGFAARPLEARGARRALPVAIALALASEKAFGDAIVASRELLYCGHRRRCRGLRNRGWGWNLRGRSWGRSLR